MLENKTILKADVIDSDCHGLQDGINFDLEDTACAICIQSEAEKFLSLKEHGIDFTNVICRNCGLVYINPRFTKKSYINYYKSVFAADRHNVKTYGDAINKVSLNYKNSFPKYMITAKEFRRHIDPNMRIMDVGCGYGYLMQAISATTGAKNIKGVEVAPFAARIAREMSGFDIFHGDFDEFCAHNNEKFDFITLYHVFEHFTDPNEKLFALSRMLSDNGLLYLGLPNILDMREPYDRFFQIPHPYAYNPATIIKLLDKNGFTILDLISRCKIKGMSLVARKKDSFRGFTVSSFLNIPWTEVTVAVEANIKKYSFYRNLKKFVLAFLPKSMRNFFVNAALEIWRILRLA